MPLHFYHFFSKQIRFGGRISWVYPFTDAPYHIVNIWDNCLPNEISKHDYCEHGSWPLQYSIELHYGSGEEFRDQLAHNAWHRKWRQLSWRQDTTIWSCQRDKANTIDIFQFDHHSYEFIEHHHLSETLQSIAWSYPLITNTEKTGRNRETIASQYSYDYIPSNRVNSTDSIWCVHWQLS